MSKVSLKNIKKSYGKNSILKGIDIEIQDKEFLVLVGPSGCGKSTLLRIIAGLENIDSGDIFIANDNVTHIHPKDRDVAFVFQNYALYPHMSVFENMAFPLKMRKIPKKEIQEKVEKTAKTLDLTEYLNRKPAQLSGGQRQRVALGRAIVRNPNVFLMDEPLSNLDAKLRSSMRFEIKKLHQKLNTTFIYVTHDQTEAMTMGDRIAVLNNGELQQIGSAEDIYNNPTNTFVAGFMGTPPMNFLDGNIKNGSIYINEIKLPMETDLPDNKDIIIGVRPEDFALCEEGQIQGEVQLIEMLGAQKLLHLEFKNSKLTIQIPADENLKQGQEVRFNLTGKVFLFDKNTKERL